MDVAELKNWAKTYIEAQKSRVASADDPLWWAIDRFFELMDASPEVCWQALLEICRRNPPEEVIEIAGSGPLEDLIDRHGDRFIDQIEAEARESPVFKKMLSSVWKSGNSDTWSRIIQVRESPNKSSPIGGSGGIQPGK